MAGRGYGEVDGHCNWTFLPNFEQTKGEDEDTEQGYQMIQLASDTSQGPKFRKELQVALFPCQDAKKPDIISENSKMFTELVSSLSVFEDRISKSSVSVKSQELDEILSIVRSHYKLSLPHDLPFYIYLLSWFNGIASTYNHEGVQKFVRECLSLIESMEGYSLSRSLNSFTKRGNFQVQVSLVSSIPPEEIFMLLDKACSDLFNVSYKEFARKGKKELDVYPIVMWKTFSAKFQSHCQPCGCTSLEQKCNKMHPYLLKECELTEEVISAISKGADLCAQLEIPQCMSLVSPNLHVLFPTTQATPFLILRKFCEAILNKFQVKSSLLGFIAVVRSAYHITTKIPYKVLSDVKRTENISEGMKVVNKFYKALISFTDGKKETVHEEIMKWLKIIISLISLKSANLVGDLKIILEDGEKEINAVHLPDIQQQIINRFSDQECRLMSFDEFWNVVAVKELPLQWPEKVMTKFLRNWTAPKKWKLRDEKCRLFLSDIVYAIQGSIKIEILRLFIEKIASNYSRKYELLQELLAMKIPDVFKGEQQLAVCSDISILQFAQSRLTNCTKEEDQKSIAIFQKNLIELLLREWSQIVSISKKILMLMDEIELGKFQLVLAEVSYSVIMSDKKLTYDETGMNSNPLVMKLFHSCTEYLNGIQSLPITYASAKQCFCWGIVAKGCCFIQMDTQRLEVFKRYWDLILLLSECYSKLNWPNYSSHFVGMEFSSNIKGFIGWVNTIKECINEWNSRFLDQDLNFDEIVLYETIFQKFQSLSSLLGIQTPVPCEQLIKNNKSKFLISFESLNELLVRFIEGSPQQPSQWCSLMELLDTHNVTLPRKLDREIDQAVVFSDDIKDSRKFDLIKNLTEPGTFPQSIKKVVRLTKQCSLAKLLNIVQELEVFLEPISSHMVMLTFFKFNKSDLFERCLNFELRLTPMPLSVEILAESLKSTKMHLQRVLCGEATYNEITAQCQISLEDMHFDLEFDILCSYFDCLPNELENVTYEGIEHVRELFELLHFHDHIKIMIKVFKDYDLIFCSNDTKFEELKKKVCASTKKESLYNITAREASLRMKEVQSILGADKHGNVKYLELFKAVSNSTEFRKFIKDYHFDEEDGQARFDQKYRLITAQLMHEEYNDTVLNELPAAYKVMIPFMNTNQTFSELITEVSNLGEHFSQLETVCTNITLIRLWFSRAEGDTIENTLTLLQDVTRSGIFEFQQEQKVLVTLKFGGNLSSASPNSSIEWDVEDINDFIRKLGILESDKKIESTSENFIQVYEAALKICEFYKHLKDLGSPQIVLSMGLKCSDVEEANATLQNVNDKVVYWEELVSNLYSQYEWLLFFRVPKVVHLYNLLCKNKRTNYANEILREISFLSENSFPRKNWMSQVQQALQSIFNVEECTCDLPMLIVGKFLNLVFNDLKLPVYGTHPPMQRLMFLHNCCQMTRGQMIQTVISVCSGALRSYEVIRCCSTTTKKEVLLYLRRGFHFSLRIIFLDVNKLSFELQEVIMRMDPLEELSFTLSDINGSIHFFETEPCLLREAPWIQHYKTKEQPAILSEATKNIQQFKKLFPVANSSIKLVLGAEGDGKTHYIRKELENKNHCVITINEAFTSLKAIQELNTLRLSESKSAIFFNFTIIAYKNSNSETKCTDEYTLLIEKINWFFFDLFILGYVEDVNSGESFYFPDRDWLIYIEIPAHEGSVELEEVLNLFYEEVPVLCLLGSTCFIDSKKLFDIDKDVQLVCKYLNAYDKRTINRVRQKDNDPLVKFSTDPDLSHQKCHELLDRYIPAQIRSRKVNQKLFVKLMERRCKFLDNMPAFNFNYGHGVYTYVEGKSKDVTDTTQLGSTLMEAMLSEVKCFCLPSTQVSGSHRQSFQLIYDFKDEGGSIGIILRAPSDFSIEKREAFKKIGIQFPTIRDLCTRKVLDEYLSRALNVPLIDGCLSIIDKSSYVLTTDFTIKMLNIHERRQCGIPVILEGETGVGKTALIEMLSKLWNEACACDWHRNCDRIIDGLERTLIGLLSYHPEQSALNVHFETTEKLTARESVTDDQLLALLSVEKMDGEKLYLSVKKILLSLETVITTQLLPQGCEESWTTLFNNLKENCTNKLTMELLKNVLSADTRTMFFKINVHSAMTPKDVAEHFRPIFKLATSLKKAAIQSVKIEDVIYEHLLKDLKQLEKRVKPSFFSGLLNRKKKPLYPERKDCSEFAPLVTVFLDELNSSSCPGLFKEVLVDKTFNGSAIPDNVFVIAACNPHRGNSMAFLNMSTNDEDNWIRGTYYVHRLHPTLKLLMWDYGSLDDIQEKEYIFAKIEMLSGKLSPVENESLAQIISESQRKIRDYTCLQFCKRYEPLEQAMKLKVVAVSRCCVSQRDIQRVFTFYRWFKDLYAIDTNRVCSQKQRRALLLSVGIVYYMRLNSEFRKEYIAYIDSAKFCLGGDLKFAKAFQEELDWFISKVVLPPGIAQTQALKENVLANIVCTFNRIPLIIVGPPGSSKTLSFNLTVENLKGPESRTEIFRDMKIFCSLDPYPYQCSRRTTSNEVETVFSRAIARQRSHLLFGLPRKCVVFMDEVGLPVESHESLKVLHYHLDKQEVAFVAITNHILDAAKTNRAVSLFRPEAQSEDIEQLAEGCYFSASTPKNNIIINRLRDFCRAYNKLIEMPQFANFFGLRDFVHFLKYLRQKKEVIPKVVLKAIEQNFNGCLDFKSVFSTFLSENDMKKVHCRDIVSILRCHMNSPQTFDLRLRRYMLIIDPSEDNSTMTLLFAFGVLNRKETDIYACSNFSDDGEIQKIDTIAAIRDSALYGRTVVMCQTDDIHESFYDLFNQRFNRIDTIVATDQGKQIKEPRYFTNIAIGSYTKPYRIVPKFKCVVIIKKSEVSHTPSPFLNRFEKYLVSHDSLLESVLSAQLPPSLSSMVMATKLKLQKFSSQVGGEESFYGFCSQTISSLLLSHLPLQGCNKVVEDITPDHSVDLQTFIVQQLIQCLKNVGFHLPEGIDSDEFLLDINSIFEVVLQDHEFSELRSTLTHDEVSKAIKQAMNILLLDDTATIVIGSECCFVLTLLQQWLVRFFCKRLMRLLTSEALVLQRVKIPSSYLQNYLRHQVHVSLQNLVRFYHTKFCALNLSKVLCFTRSSPLIYKLSSEHFNSLESHRATSGSSGMSLSCIDLTVTVVINLSQIHRQSRLQELFVSFLENLTSTTCLVLVNLRNISIKLINLVRIMIEEVENARSVQNGKKKLFVLLLHFPSVVFIEPTYPALFSQGWDHCYLETIGHNADVVEVHEWLFNSCFPQQQPISGTMGESDLFMSILNKLLPQAISYTSSCLNYPLTIGKTLILITNLFSRDRNGLTVSTILNKRFWAYWKPAVIVQHMEEAAHFSKLSESALSMADAIHIRLKNYYFSFILNIVCKILQEVNFESAHTYLISDFLQVLPVPKLRELHYFSKHLLPDACKFQFPFFRTIFNIMETIIERSHREMHVNVNPEQEFSKNGNTDKLFVAHEVNLTMLRQVAEKNVQKEMEGKNKSVLESVVKALSETPELWDVYFKDFVILKHHLRAEKLATEILYRFFERIHKLPPFQKIVHLHSYFHINTLNMISILCHIGELEKLDIEASHHESVLPTESHKKHSERLKLASKPDLETPTKNFMLFVVDTLFDSITSFIFPHDLASLNMLVVWFKVFRNVISTPNIKNSIRNTRDFDSTVQAKLNVLQATFLVLGSGDFAKNNSSDIGQRVFRALINRHFDEGLKLRSDSFPRLSAIAPVVIELTSTEDLNKTDLQRISIEGLLDYFFPPDANKPFDIEDVKWFLDFANKQSHWISNLGQEVPSTMLSLCKCKLYLRSILTAGVEEQQTLFNFNPVHIVEINKILSSTSCTSTDRIYPAFYRKIFHLDHENTIMDTPLAHLTFMTTLEYLLDNPISSRHATLVKLISVAKGKLPHPLLNSSECQLSDQFNVIELQAIKQIIAQRIAETIVSGNRDEEISLFRVIVNINEILGEKHHGMVILLHTSDSLSEECIRKKISEIGYGAINCIKAIITNQCVDLASEIRHLKPYYSQSPAIKDVDGLNGMPILKLLHSNWDVLHTGGELLPDLLEFYLWLHRNLAYNITKERARALSIEDVIKKACSQSNFKNYIRDLYESVKENFNRYVELIPETRGSIVCISGEIPLLHFLSLIDHNSEDTPDLLYKVITTIVDKHNKTVDTVHSTVMSQHVKEVARLIPQCLTEIHVKEFKMHHCVVVSSVPSENSTPIDGRTLLQQIIRSRCYVSTPKESLEPVVKFFEDQLEADVVSTFVVGKPKITPLRRQSFDFKKDEVLIDVSQGLTDVEDLQQKLGPILTKKLSVANKKHLKNEFHILDYKSMNEVAISLQIVCSYADKVILEECHKTEEGNIKESLTILEFMRSYVDASITNFDHSKIGILQDSLTETQASCLSRLPLNYAFSCLQLFVQWIQEGFYNFRHLPLVVKTSLSKQDEQFIQCELQKQWYSEGDSLNNLQIEVKTILKILRRSEEYILEQRSQVSIMKVLEDHCATLLLDVPKLSALVPRTILSIHYVHFQMLLRRLLLGLSEKLTSHTPTSPEERWLEVVDDLWTKYLPHIKEEQINHDSFVYDTKRNCFGFQEGSDDEDVYMSTKEDSLTSTKLHQRDASVQPQLSFSDMTVEQVCQFLDTMKPLDKYKEIIQEMRVSGDILVELSDKDLEKELGIKSKVHRLRLQKMAKEGNKSGKQDGSLAKLTEKQISCLLTNMKGGLESFSKIFQKEGVSGSILVELDEFDLENDLGVTSTIHKKRLMKLITGKEPVDKYL